jgi:glycosyltransferase involved in cell wall biosynthesis
VILGAPPEAEVGYAIAAFVAAVAKPREVVVVDLQSGTVETYGFFGFVGRAAPAAFGQLLASSLAVGAQALAARAARRSGTDLRVAPELRRLIYLRPSVGTPSAVGGSITHSNEVIRALRDEGVDVAALTTDRSIAATAAADPDPPCEWRLLRAARALKALPASAAVADDLALIRAGLVLEGDVVYQRHGRFSLCGAVLSQLLGRPLFLEYNGSEQFRGRYWDPTPLAAQLAACELAALTAATRIFVVSEADREDLVRKGIASHRVIVNENGVASHRFAQGGGPAIRASLGFAEKDIVVGFIGTFGPWHGAPTMARAFCRVAKRTRDLRLLLVGEGPELDRTREELRAGGFEQRATFVGTVAPHRVAEYLDACDVLVSPHIPLPDGIAFFGSPTKLFEYMASGKAIVASRLGQIADVLEHERTALLVTPGDEQQLASAIERLAEAPELRQELGRRALQHAAERHSWSRNARRIIDAFESLDAR